ncbi:MAG: phosphoethanolamine--lipid A transferase [Pseudomonadales bacterium]|nr:phosphoethanolamine--lipid A transferase [Pseudomonadales bacterium]
MRFALKPWQLVILTSVFVTITGNATFLSKLTDVYPLSLSSAGFIASTLVVLSALLVVLLMPLAFAPTVRPAMIFVIGIAAFGGYFEDTYGTVIDTIIIRSLFATNAAEATDLANVWLFVRLFLFGVIPAVLVWRVRITPATLPVRLRQDLVAAVTSLAVAIGTLLLFSANYTSFFREHKPVRYYANPHSTIYAIAQTAAEVLPMTESAGAREAIPARIERSPGQLPRLVILVVGEAVRADHFGLNGYERNTTPTLAGLPVYNFTDVSSCGTATAISVPCMFSPLGRESFSLSSAASHENLLDIVKRAGVDVMWRDNNSDSKGVADRVEVISYRNPDVNPVCDPECRDVGMLSDLQSWIDQRAGRDLLVVLHQMGNHGPAYYKRYPADWEKWKPVCHSNELSECTDMEISNAYDNAIRYTDYFLGEVIGLLSRNEATRQTAMVYLSDHGESLGEYGLYLHGMPYSLAPRAQTWVPMVMYFGPDFDVDRPQVEANEARPWSQDNLFHTVLDLFGVETPALDPAMSMLR